ncbi:MAG: YlbF family regulator, partial [Streptococcaceae bacterium]|nr:YlbF family regulator [Streptococcaceae bacterium]
CIKNSLIYQTYISLKEELENDEQVNILRQNFEKEKAQFDKIKEYGFHAPGYRELQTKTQQAKRALDMYEVVANFRQAENQLQTLLDEITQKIASCVSQDILIESGNPFFDNGKKGHHSCVS